MKNTKQKGFITIAIIGGIALLLAGALGVYVYQDGHQEPIISVGAPSGTSQKNILPFTTQTYDLGSTTPALEWNGVYTKDLFVSGTCTGCGSGSAFAWTPTGYGVSTSTTLGFLNGFLSTASSTINSTLLVTGTTTTQTIGFQPTATQSITAVTNTIVSNNTLLSISADADYVMTSTPTIASSTAGTLLILHNIGSFDIDLQANSVLNGSGIYNEGVDSILEPNDLMSLIFLANADGSGNAGWRVQAHPNPSVAAGSANLLDVRNTTGSSIASLKPVYRTGYNSGQNRVTIGLADGDDATKMPAIGVTFASIGNNANGQIITSGEILNVNTSAWTAGDVLYPSTTAGTFTTTRPSVDKIQAVARVLYSHATKGVILVVGAGRTNDVPWSATFTNATTTSLGINSETFTDLTGTGLTNVGGVLTSHAAITVSGTPNYITLSGQDLVRAKLDISDDTNLTCGTGCTLTANDIAIDASQTQITALGTIGTGVWEATDVGVAHGGTGKSSWTQYLIPYADTTTSFSQIAIGTSGQVLTSGGAGVAPAFETLSIAAGEYAAASIDGDDINSNLAGRSLTLTSASPDTLDADAELYTYGIASNLFATTTADGIATTTENFVAVRVPVASTITGFDCYADDTGTSTIRATVSSNPLSAGTDILYTTGVNCGADVYTATSTFGTTAVSAGDIIRFYVFDAEPTGSRPRVIYPNFELTKDD